jgi:hypothetical protein
MHHTLVTIIYVCACALELAVAMVHQHGSLLLVYTIYSSSA